MIERAGKHTVIKLSRLVGRSAVEPFKIVAGRDNVDVPRFKGLEMSSYVLVEPFYFLHIAHSFSVGGIADDRTSAVGGLFYFTSITMEKVDIFLDSRAQSVLVSYVEDVLVDIRCPSLKFGIFNFK